MTHDSDARRAWLVAFVVALLLYTLTASHQPQWQDSGWQQIRILTGQLEHPLGLALVHPLHHFLGRAAVAMLPFVEPAFATTLVSALAAAVAIANVAGMVMLLTGFGRSAAVAAGSLGLAHTFWQFATHTESYALVAALLTAEWLCIARYVRTRRTRPLLALAFFNGLGFSNHVLAALAVPIYAVVFFFAARDRRRPAALWLAGACWWALGAMPYLALIAARMVRTGEVLATLGSAFFGEYRTEVLNASLSVTMLARSASYVAYNLPNLTLPLAAAALLGRPDASLASDSSGRPAQAYLIRVLAAAMVVYGLFVIRYSITDQYTFFVPIYCALAVLAGLGLARLPQPLRRRAAALAMVLLLMTPVVYVVAPRVLSIRALPGHNVQDKPFRGGFHALLVPWGAADDYAAQLNGVALRLAGNDGIILTADPMTAFSLQYLEALGRKPASVQLISIATPSDARVAELNQLAAAALRQGRSVVLVPAHRDRPETCLAGATWRREADLYVLESLGQSNPP